MNIPIKYGRINRYNLTSLGITKANVEDQIYNRCLNYYACSGAHFVVVREGSLYQEAVYLQHGDVMLLVE